MKKLLINSTLLFILVIFPVIPSYLNLYNQISNPKLKLCVDNGVDKNINILKGDLAYLEAIFARALENNKNEESKTHELNITINLLFFTSQSKIDFFNPFITINKLMYSKNNDLSAIYLKIPSPPPKYIS
ncbi:MAG: hypothetical protein ABFR32_02400 [Bacteroidota bacterium]